MEISVSTGLYYTKGYKEILDIIGATTCKNIELFLNQAFIDVPVDELKRELEQRNLNVTSIHTPLEFIAFKRNENEDYWVKKSIDIAKVLGAKVIVSHMVVAKFCGGNDGDLDDSYKENILEYSKEKEVYIVTENLPFNKSKSFLFKYDELFDFVSKNNVNMTFDTTHAAFSDMSILENYKRFKPFIKNIHLSDFDNGNEHKVLGTGSLPLKELLLQLKEDNYDGLITIELDFDNPNRNTIRNNEEAVSSIQKSIDFVKDAIK